MRRPLLEAVELVAVTRAEESAPEAFGGVGEAALGAFGGVGEAALGAFGGVGEAAFGDRAD